MARDDNMAHKPIMVRATLTDEEWLELRMLSLRSKVNVQDIVGKLIREHLDSAGVAA